MFRRVKEGALAEHSIVGILRKLGKQGKGAEMRLPTRTERDLEYYRNTMELIKRYEKEGFVIANADRVVLTQKGQGLVKDISLVGGGNNVLYSKKKLQLSPNTKRLRASCKDFEKKFSRGTDWIRPHLAHPLRLRKLLML